MGKTDKTLALILVLIMAISCLTLFIVKPVNAQSVLVPTFTISTITGSYTVPTTYSTNPYTGTEVTHQGYTVTYFNITFTIQNPPFFTVQNPPIASSYTSYYYVLEFKGHYTSQWTFFGSYDSNITVFAFSGSQTVIILSGNPSSNQISLQYVNFPYAYAYGGAPITVPLGGQIDFRMQAVSSHAPFIPNNAPYIVQGNVGAFSAVQTVTIPNNFTSTSTSTPTSPTSTSASSSPSTSFWMITTTISLIVIAILLGVLIALLILMRHRKPL